MFTGIIESAGILDSVVDGETGKSFLVSAPFSSDLMIGESVAVDGVCFTVTEKRPEAFAFFASRETLGIANFSSKKKGDLLNLERSLKVGDRISGHFVYGHVDAQAKLVSIEKNGESRVLRFSVGREFHKYLVPKGSVALNGISLTVFEKNESGFGVMIIPHTWDKTNLHLLAAGDSVNIEFDFLGKYLENFHAATH
ncbi:MAG: riboflavin synthase [Spirochaetia bacterium]|nr:riboflavin synthase [Spirochaetia bacterium]